MFSPWRVAERDCAILFVNNELPRQTWREMFRHADRSNASPPAAVRNAESFVQIQMANIRADVAGPAKADLRVHVCAIHVNLTAMRMNDLADFPDRCFKNS